MVENPIRSSLSSAHGFAEELDEVLGDPMDEGSPTPFTYRAIVEAEERNELPEGAEELLRSWGFPEYLVPHFLGGRLGTLEELLLLTRVISRRNLTCAVMFGSTLLAVNPVWLWGRPDQQKTVAQGLLEGDLACFGVSEEEQGSDLRGSETRTDSCDGNLLLTGTKWPVGNATRGRFVTTYAKTDVRTFSLLLVDKSRTADSEWRTLPYVKTVGLRGHDLSGIEFSGTRLSPDCVIGRSGSGLVQTLKALQITRTAISALSLGTMDAVLRIGMDYAHRRNLYGAEIYRIPIIREQLIRAHLDLLIAECVAVPVARSLTFLPGRLSLWSSVVKYLVPTLGEEVVAGIGSVLAARSYLREGVAHGVFQKLQRDHSISGIFEGTTQVNLANVADQLPHIFSGERTDERSRSVLGDIFSWTRTPPIWNPEGQELRLTNEGFDEITQSFDQLSEELADNSGGRFSSEVAADLSVLLDRIGNMRVELRREVRSAQGDTSSAAAIYRARRHCELHAMASCILTWFHNFEEFGGVFARGEWLVLCLQRLLQRSSPNLSLTEKYLSVVEAEVMRSRNENSWFSLLQLAGRT